MRDLTSIDFERCRSGIEFEEWMKELLIKLSFQAARVGKNDCGVDIVALASWRSVLYRFFIQCKYYNRPLGKAPIQEIYTGTAHSEEYGNPVVITNNIFRYSCWNIKHDIQQVFNDE